MDDAEFRPLVPFDDDSPSFVHGFEAGMIWQRMQMAEDVIEPEIPLHAANMVVVERMADAAGYDMDKGEPDGEWVPVTFTLRPPSPKRHLRVV